jgi:hypothetical protein
MTATAKKNFLFVSDLEGCELYGRFNNKKQNTSMCKTAFFETLEDSYLKDKENNHICFLGDYFDQGPYVFESIIGIAYLKNKYESQVHIILGNRDINKFRLFYESKLGEFDQALITQVNETGMFSPLEIQYKPDDLKIMNQLSNPTFTMYWMHKTMGINNYDIKKCNKELNHGLKEYEVCRHGLKLHPDKSDIDCNKLLKDAFTPSNFSNEVNFNQADSLDTLVKKDDNFKIAIKIIYTKGNIVELIDNNLLLSHAGGYSKNITAFGNDEQIKAILKNDTISKGNYYTIMNDYRNILTSTDPKEDNDNNISGVINTHRTFYNDFINLFSKQNDAESEDCKHRHLLLQAMGLKPNAKAEKNNGFASFIESCDHIPIKNTFKDNDFWVNNANWPKYNAHGHINFGLDTPIIYRRKDKIIFACDTSVGMRPVDKPFKMNYLEAYNTENPIYKYGEYKEGEKTINILPINYTPPIVSETISEIFTKLIHPSTGGRRRKSRRNRKSKKSKKTRNNRRKSKRTSRR